jgi:uroporphyrinogen III methyltransferase / synthase
MSGRVYLVGAGPGDPGLATDRALALLERADVVVYDRLAPSALIERARGDAELVYAGKRPGAPSLDQDAITDVLIERARAGATVVRLKGGDPFVFGRGGEEAEALAAAGVEFEVVPGVTAGIAAPAYAGIPVTHRDLASAVAFVTGHEDPGKPEGVVDWPALASFPGTLVLYMGVRTLGETAERLIAAGRSRDEPAAVIERGSLPDQRTVVATLCELAARVAEEGIEPPAVTVIGPVAALHDRLDWVGRGPLHGKTVAVTRARAQASALAERLRTLGAAVLEAPAIRIEPRLGDASVRAAVSRLAAREFDVVCLTSPNGVRLMMEALRAAGLDARALAGATLAAIGPGTDAALFDSGLRADLLPERSVAEELVAALASLGLRGKRALVARASEARDTLPRGLEEAGAEVEVVALYDTVPEPLDDRLHVRLERADYVTFTSSSTVRFLLAGIGGGERFPSGARVVSIGPVTSETARALGLEVHVEADRHDIDGLIDALVGDAVAESVAR